MRSLESEISQGINPEFAHKKALEVLEVDAIQMEGFADLYGEETIRQDQAYVEKREREIAESDTPEAKRLAKIATILEAIIHEQVERSDWLGPEAHTIKPTRYDDLRASVDSLVEFQSEEEQRASYLGLAIDVTFSKDVSKKLERIRELDIKQGKLARLKYFNSEYMGIRGELKNIPSVVIGADLRAVEELTDAWLDPDRAKKNKFFANHPLQFMLLEEIQEQLGAFEDYARSIGKTDVADVYARTNAIISRILEEKDVPKNLGALENDRVHGSIRENLKTLFRPEK